MLEAAMHSAFVVSPGRSPPLSLAHTRHKLPCTILRRTTRASAFSLQSVDAPSRPEQAGPAADLLFDLFELAFSPIGFAAVIALTGLLLVLDSYQSTRGRNILGQPEEREEPTRFAIRFTVRRDGFYESPSGGAEKVEAGASYVEEFDSMSASVALARALERNFGKGKVSYETFQIRGNDWVSKPASSKRKDVEEGAVGGSASRAEDDEGAGGGSDLEGVDAEWAKIMNKMKPSAMPGMESVTMQVITGENACRLCNGKGVRGCSKCSVSSMARDGYAVTSEDEQTESNLNDDQCQACAGRKVVPCEWCAGSGIRDQNT
mmetsp:Transcript_17208/g.35193  ORF Transcript_17208/g.35193 Transcript_17208/m.35193 type:complete len:319 (-) Transcript_17208:56-1012(-)